VSVRQTTWPEIEPSDYDEIIDVRSPSEFAEDRLPGAINLPVLDDEERARIGTLNREKGAFAAKRDGASLVSRHLADHLESHFADKPRSYRPLVYCWRGGQRSASLVTVLSSIGWGATQLAGGYKGYRRLVLERLEALPSKFDWIAIGGLTGTAKTAILLHLEPRACVLDLEGLAHHKGSVLGPDPDQPQPSQKAFEAAILAKLEEFTPGSTVLVESESRKVGNLHCPPSLWTAMTGSRVLRIELPFAERVRYLLRDYDYFVRDPEFLTDRVARLGDRHGAAKVEAWTEQIRTGRWEELVGGLLRDHYDPLYLASTRYPKPTWLLELERYDEEQLTRVDRWYDEVVPAPTAPAESGT